MRRIATLFVIVAALGAAGPRDARALCQASDVIAADPGCGASGECRITRTHAIDNDNGNGCVLDFSGRDLTVVNGGILNLVNGASVTIFCRHLTVGGLIDGRPAGGTVKIVATGDVAVEQSSQRGIVVIGNAQAGNIALMADGNIVINGRLKANNANAQASGGQISLEAAGTIVLASTSDVDVGGGSLGSGGSVDLVAGGLIDIRKDINASGGEGGGISVSGSDVTVGGKLLVNGDSSGSGGSIDVTARDNVSVNQAIQGRGSGGADGGGDGGEVSIQAESGSVVVRNEISVRSGSPDGTGGDITVSAGSSVDVQSGGKLNAEGVGSDSSGGSVSIEAELDVTVSGRVEAPAGSGEGEILLTAGRDTVIAADALVDARGHTAGSASGEVRLDAGTAGPGHLTIDGTVSAAGAPCAGGARCSAGGGIDASGCDITVGSTATLDVRAPGPTGQGGTTVLTARRQLTVQGTVIATGSGVPGRNTFVRPSARPLVLTGSVTPTAQVTVCSTNTCQQEACAGMCTGLCECGNLQINQFEQCDSSAVGCAPGAVCGAPGTAGQCTCSATCGNGVLDPGEECDGGVVGTCQSRGFAHGDLGCVDCAVDQSGCDAGFCGDGIIASRAGEVCEMNDLAGVSCELLGFPQGGTLACGPACTGFDVAGCVRGVCGDGSLDGDEECDEGAANADVPNAPCRTDCTAPRCGDGVRDDQAGEECDDGNPSDQDGCFGTCRAAVCGDGIVCSDPGCSSGPDGGPEECDGLATCCLSTCGPRRCDDRNSCTDDACDPATGCVHVPTPGASACDDGNACTTDDACRNGACVGGRPLACDDGESCTEDRCDAAVGCVHEFIDGPCDDGDGCTTDRCVGGVCSGAVTGLGGVTCRLDELAILHCEGAPLPGNLVKLIAVKVKKASALLEKTALAAAAGKGSKARKLQRKAAKQLDVISRKAATAARSRKASRHITETCRRSIDSRVQERQQLVATAVF